MTANDGYPRPSLFDYLRWAFVYDLYTERGLRDRAKRVGENPYGKFLIEVADARKTKGLSGVNAMKIVHEHQRRTGAR